ncbi:peptidylprolyl isomerase [Halopseudomonas salegens]|uniref:Chaperone SurA n=1 Tax=Halopseudomonas salegens TaxID=1434072 RepID=A0A1H2DX68_9GAMM|nr:peptidylprolyl isomerase [Halopseudomonas salegens]SDT87440.1 periplasmic chaperone for outer membrane proteins SurA [Halopseudomonas salegens]
MPFKLYTAVLSLCAGLFITSAQAQVVPLDRVAAIVDNDVVMLSQVQQRVDNVRRQVSEQGGEIPPADVLRQQVLEQLILESIQLQMGDRAGIRIDDNSLNQTMQQLAQRNGVTLDEFRAALERDGISYAAAREQVRREMIISRVRQRRVAERIQVSDQEVRNFLNSELGRTQLAEEFRLAMIILPLDEYASAEEEARIRAAADDIYQELQAGADFADLARSHAGGDLGLEGGELGWRKANQLPGAFASAVSELDVGEITRPLRSPSGLHILKLLEERGGDGQLVTEYQVRHILIRPSEIRSENETAQLIQRLYERIRNGESFENLARAFSEDPGSALNGGSMGWTTADSVVPEFAEVMTTLPEGQVSRPLETQYGWHIIEVTDQRRVDMTDDMREQQATSLLQNRKFDDELQTWLLEIRQDAYVEIKI